MKIVMFTNTFTPHVGGVARSVQQFTREFRALGHRVLIVAPEFESVPEGETQVLRIPAVQHFNGSDFSVPVPTPGHVTAALDEFQPDLVHSHHPFLLGDTALRVSAARNIPVVFTHHTQYEKYTHYVPGDSPLMQRFVVELAVGYCNLCDAVIAPSRTILERLRDQGVSGQMVEIPTGVDAQHFRRGDGVSIRRRLGIDDSAFVVGNVGRLAPEKGLEFLAECVSECVNRIPGSVFLIAGQGPSEKAIRQSFDKRGLTDQLIMLGNLGRNELADVYDAMNVFVFASQSETQGMVLTEAMAASTPVVAVAAPGVREILRDNRNGLLIEKQDKLRFIDALCRVNDATPELYQRWVDGAHETAEQFSMESMAARTLQLYEQLVQKTRDPNRTNDAWSSAMRRVEEEWKIWSNVVDAAGHAILGPDIKVF